MHRRRLKDQEWLTLEPRVLLSAGAILTHDQGNLDVLPAIHTRAKHRPVARSSLSAAGRRPAKRSAAIGSATAAAIAATPAAGTVPALNSFPSAAVKIYLDFTGAAGTPWGTYTVPATPAYDVDGNPSAFSATELANINQIWQRVAEKYSPFNVNVTTVDPGTYGDKSALRVVIGGTGTWFAANTGGVSYVGAFYDSSTPNTSWVFPVNLANGDPKDVGEAAAHEAGHSFGLEHQSTYSGTTRTNEYNTGNGLAAPIMGNSYDSTRGLWWSGTSTSSRTIQNDLSVLSGNNDGFGYRADDHGSTIATADALGVTGSSVSAAGVIEQTSDLDEFKFSTAGGTSTFSVNVAPYAAMLDAKLQVLNLSGAVLASADSANLGETLSVNLAAGNYVLVVASHGGYGDIGQYTVTGTVPPPIVVVAPQPPSGLTAKVFSPPQVLLNWLSNGVGATGARVMRSTDGVQFAQIGTDLDGSSTAYVDVNVTPGLTYSYDIVSFNSGGTSAPSNVATVTVDPNGTGLRGTYFGDETLTSQQLTRVDPVVNFNWGTGSPDPAIDSDHFGVRWSGQVQAKYSQAYTFTVKADDGVRLWVNGQLLIDQWNPLPLLNGDVNGDGSVDFFDLSQLLATKYNTGAAATYGEGDVNGDGVVDFFDLSELLASNWGATRQPASYSSGAIALQAGQKYDITLEYFDQAGPASAQLMWSSASTPLAVIPQSYLYAAAAAAPAATVAPPATALASAAAATTSPVAKPGQFSTAPVRTADKSHIRASSALTLMDQRKRLFDDRA
jgi:hypothetical protein